MGIKEAYNRIDLENIYFRVFVRVISAVGYHCGANYEAVDEIYLNIWGFLADR